MSKLRKAIPILTLLSSVYFLIWLAFGKLFTSPNTWLFGNSGDGLNNYFGPAHYMKFGKGYWTDAIAYPYGEHMLLTDSHFILVYLLNLIDDYIYPIADYSVGVINFFLIFSLGFCALFVYLILRHFRLPTWYSIISALIICFLSPQIARFIAHYSLSLAAFVPMVWYFMLRFLEQKNQLKWGLFTVLTILFCSLLHPYYLPLSVLFIFTYAFVYILQHIFSIKQHIKQIISILLLGIIPFILISIFIGLTDPVTDRHPSPYGMFSYISSFEGVFMPHRGPVRDFLHNFFFIKPPLTHEGYSYVGFIGFIVLILSGIRLLMKVAKGQIKNSLQIVRNKTLVGFLWTGFLLHLLSMATPFIHFSFILDLIPTFKQFRSLGRFAWILYYCFTVYTAYYFYLVFRSLSFRNAKTIGLWMLFFVFLVWGLESFLHTNYYTSKIRKGNMKNNIFRLSNDSYTKALESKGFKPTDFQAVLSFPYVNNGSQKFYIVRAGGSLLEMAKCGYDTGIPNATFLLPRTSVSQAINQIQLLSSEYIEKEILTKYNDKPLLIIERKGAKLKHDESRLISKCKQFYENEFVRLYEAPISVFKTNHTELHARLDTIQENLYHGNNFLSSLPSKSIILKRFENDPYFTHYRGVGAMNSGKNQRIELYNAPIPFDSVPIPLELSMWIHIDQEYASFPILFCEEYDHKTGKRVEVKAYNPKLNTEVHKDWAKASIYFQPKHPGNRILIYVREEQPLSKNHVGDDMLIRPINVDVYFDIEKDGSFVINNYSIPPREKSNM